MKRFASILCIIALLFMLFTVAYAIQGNYSYVYDYADVLTDGDERNLEDAIDKLTLSYGYPFVIITKYGMSDSSTHVYAESFYLENSALFDVLDNPVGFIFVDDFDNNTFMLYTIGDGELIISEAEKDLMYDVLNSYYDNGDCYGSYLHFIGDIEGYYSSFANDDSSSAGSTTASSYDANYDYSAPDSHGLYVVDAADLLSTDEEAALLKKIEAIQAKYNIDVVLHTTNSIDYKNIQDYADDFYDYNGYGFGDDKDGLLFMLNMNNGEEGNRDYYTSTTGNAINALTDYAIKDSASCINSKVLPFFAEGDYYKAFDIYLDLIDIFFAQAATGNPYDNTNPYETKQEKTERILILEAFVIGVACFIAFLVIKYFKMKMEIAENKKQAYDYIKPGSTVVTKSIESFSHKIVNRTKRVKESSSSSSGSSTHRSSSGTSHGGGGGKF